MIVALQSNAYSIRQRGEDEGETKEVVWCPMYSGSHEHDETPCHQCKEDDGEQTIDCQYALDVSQRKINMAKDGDWNVWRTAVKWSDRKSGPSLV